jgi:hypothetical protein
VGSGSKAGKSQAVGSSRGGRVGSAGGFAATVFFGRPHERARYPASPAVVWETKVTVGARRRGNPRSGKGRKAVTVRRHGGPGGHSFGCGGPGPQSERMVTSVVRTRRRFGDGVGSWSRNQSFGAGSGTSWRVAVSAAVHCGVDQEPSERTLAPRVSCDTHLGTHHMDEPREVGSSDSATGDRHRGAGSRTPGA